RLLGGRTKIQGERDRPRAGLVGCACDLGIERALLSRTISEFLGRSNRYASGVQLEASDLEGVVTREQERRTQRVICDAQAVVTANRCRYAMGNHLTSRSDLCYTGQTEVVGDDEVAARSRECSVGDIGVGLGVD